VANAPRACSSGGLISSSRWFSWRARTPTYLEWSTDGCASNLSRMHAVSSVPPLVRRLLGGTDPAAALGSWERQRADDGQRRRLPLSLAARSDFPLCAAPENRGHRTDAGQPSAATRGAAAVARRTNVQPNEINEYQYSNVNDNKILLTIVTLATADVRLEIYHATWSTWSAETTPDLRSRIIIRKDHQKDGTSITGLQKSADSRFAAREMHAPVARARRRDRGLPPAHQSIYLAHRSWRAP
jgi:hypothetical protein